MPKTATTATQVGVLIQNLPAGTELGFASFYLVYDKANLTLSNFVWDNTVLDTKGVDTEFADGTNTSAVRISASGSVSATKPILTLMSPPPPAQRAESTPSPSRPPTS